MLLKKISFCFLNILQKHQQTKQRRTTAFLFQSPLRNANPLKNNWLTTGTSLESHRRGYRVPPQYPPNWCSGALVESFVVCSLVPPRFNYMHNLMSFRRQYRVVSVGCILHIHFNNIICKYIESFNKIRVFFGLRSAFCCFVFDMYSYIIFPQTS